MKTIDQVTPEEVVKVYSGRPGCGCGCRGTYRVNPVHAAFANSVRSYEYEAKEFNFVQVKKVLAILQSRASEVTTTTSDNFNIYSIEDSKRYYWVFAVCEPVAPKNYQSSSYTKQAAEFERQHGDMAVRS